MMAHTQKPDFVFRRNGRVHLNRQGASVQSTTGSRGVRISGSNAGYTMFRGSVKGTGYPLHSPVSPALPPPVRHRVPSHFSWTLLWLCVISGFRRKVDENCEASAGNSLPTFRDNLSVPSSEIKKSEVVKKPQPWISWHLKKGPIGCPETSVSNYQHLMRNPLKNGADRLHITMQTLELCKSANKARHIKN